MYELVDGKIKYVTGGSSLTSGADCSGFIYRIHKNLGVSSVTLDGMRSVRKASFCKKISSKVADAKPGMILLCNTNSHVMLYLGNNKAIHMPGTGQYCKISDVKYFSFSGPYDGVYAVEGVSYATSKPSIKMTNYPTSIKKGTRFTIKGTINPNLGTTEICAYIKDKNGKKTIQSTKTYKTSSLNNYTIGFQTCEDISSQLSFHKLSKGTYTFVLTAKNSAGTSTYSKQFKVK